MKVVKLEQETRIYPFADDTTSDALLAAMGYVSILNFDTGTMSFFEELRGKVDINVQLGWLSAERWRQFKKATDLAFEKAEAMGVPRLTPPAE